MQTKTGVLGFISDVADSMRESSGIRRHDAKRPENEDEAKDSEVANTVLASIAGAITTPLAASAPVSGAPAGAAEVKMSAPAVDTGAGLSLRAPTGGADANIPGFSAEVSKPIPSIGTEGDVSAPSAPEVSGEDPCLPLMVKFRVSPRQEKDGYCINSYIPSLWLLF